ncbi:hypothetical protein JOE59_000741 [Agromyces cerinus]|uniref:glycosyltransferase n=1 Tax=Agromyces cerinus TaxID=33878 RepID=UPI00195C8514|nr:glycosyltransferase [Agromyces cerinus]MBM7830036.1 hypothetical protein [Agromyces cerinus]
MTERIVATHLFDAAGVGETLTRIGGSLGYDWRFIDARDTSRDDNRLRLLTAASVWHARRVSALLRSDLIHLHYGRRTRYLDLWPRRPYVLHFHGTDIRHHFHQPYAHDVMANAAASARAVLYSTPDLAVHALEADPRAQYFPTPIDIASLPEWRPAPTPVVAFASRWDESKDGRRQGEIADALRAAFPGVRLEGIDWGADARVAREAGVTLLPRMPKAEYLRWLAGAHVVIGQPAGVLAVSELEAIGIGVPVVMEPHAAYDTVPVVRASKPDDVAQATRELLDDPVAASRRLGGPEWVSRTHGAIDSVQRLADIYTRSLA